MPLIITIILAVVGLNILYFTPEEQTIVECPEGTVKTQFGNNFECLTKQEPTPFPSPTPTSKPQAAYKQAEATPRPTNKPQVEPTPKSTTDPDPIVNCHGARGGQCENQTIKLRRSECNGSSSFVCCQVDNGWKLMSRSECTKAQNNEARPTNSKPQNIDTINTPIPPTSTYKSGYTPKLLITCIVNYPCTGNSYTYQVDQESCNNFQQSAFKICSSSQTNSTNSYVPPVGYENQPTQDVIYGRDNRRIEENEQRKAPGVIPGYEPIKQDVIYGRGL